MFPNIDYSKRKAKPINYDTIMRIRISKGLKDRITKLSEKKQITVSDIVRKALQNYLAIFDE